MAKTHRHEELTARKVRNRAGNRVQVGKIDLPVTFLSYGPRIGHGAGKEAVTRNPQTAIVWDANGNFITVRLAEVRSAS